MDVSYATRRLNEAFPSNQSRVLAEVIVDSIESAQKELVKAKDFNELKSIVKELAVAQKRTESRMEELAASQKELSEAQKRTEEVMQELARQQASTRSEVGGLARNMAYSLENEAYRYLPKYLEKNTI